MDPSNTYVVLCFAPKSLERRLEKEKIKPRSLRMPNQFFTCIMVYCDSHNEINSENYTKFDRLYHPAVVVVIEFQAIGLYGLPLMIRQKCLRYEKFDDWRPEFAENCAIHGFMKEPAVPFVSIITTAFQSQDRINRVFQSLMKQTYTNWEWIIYDENHRDSDDSKELLLKVKRFQKKWPFIQYYQPQDHDGRIGYAKRKAFGLATGQWLCEMDHDDELVPQCLDWLCSASKKCPDAGFAYTDSLQIHEGSKDPHSYGDFYAFGFGSDYRFLFRGKQHFMVVNPPLNIKTLSHIVGIPNHLRAWRSDIYHQVGGHNIALSVGDDYELFLRTFCTTKCVHIAELGYVQYMNEGFSNFTFKRNALIQYNVLHTSVYHRNKIIERIEDLTKKKMSPEEKDVSKLLHHNQQDWFVSRFQYPKLEYTFVPSDQDANAPLISIVMPTFNRPNELKKAIASVVAQSYTNWVCYIIGDHCSLLDNFMQIKAPTFVPRDILKTRIRWSNLSKNHGSGGAVPRNYALKMLVKTNWVGYLDDDNEWTEDHLANAVEMIKTNPEIGLVYSDFEVDKKIIVGEPRRGRIDTSTVVHRMDLLREEGINLWLDRSTTVYWHDWVFFEQLIKKTKCASTSKSTMRYSTKYNQQTYESIMAIQS
jgi:glycosyltransferase involved in cell wall biosynthesis